MTITTISSDLDQKVLTAAITEVTLVPILTEEVMIDLIDGVHHHRTATTTVEEVPFEDEVHFVGGVPMEDVVVDDIKNNQSQS